jgi:3-hydroxyacyl-CoA dehydrogenase
VGLHYFNPVQLMRLTEVIKTSHTSPEVFQLALKWSNSLGKTSVACGDTPGFIVNRLLVPSLAQAILLVERGDATVHDVDVSMQLGNDTPWSFSSIKFYVMVSSPFFF